MTTETITFKIDKDLKLELKMVALKQDRTVRDILNGLIQDFVDENK